MFRLSLFGRFSLVSANGAEVTITSGKGKALLAYLAQTPGKPRSREEIMALLWSDRGETQGRASLRQVLTGLRKELGGDLLKIDRNSVTLDANIVELLPAGGEEFLSGFHLNDPAFADWLRDKRLEFDSPSAPGRLDRTQDSPNPLCIAVLPFTNLSSDEEQHYFADGITEDIITELARFRTLLVIGRSSAFAYREQGPDPLEARARLGARFLVRGSVRRAEDRLRVSVHLVDVESGARIWADRYDRDVQDVFAVQDEIVESVVAKLGVSLDGIETARAKTRPTRKLRAYDVLLQARSFWWHGKETEAYRLAGRSVQEDPDFALAHAYFALQNAYQFFSGSMGLSRDTIAEKCRFHAETALDLDDTNPVVHAYASMAFGFSPLAAKERGLKHISIAVTQNPNDCELMLLHAWQLSFAGDHEQAVALLGRVSSLNPLGGYMIAECYADTYYMMGDYEKALDSYNDQGAPPPQSRAVFAACHAQMGRVDEAHACLLHLEEVKPMGFDAKAFADAQCTSCLREIDRKNWLDGFRRAGVDI